MVITKEKRELLIKFVDNICEGCKKKFEKGLEIHRIHRGNLGGTYILRNVLVLCSKCHELIHANELGIGGR